MVFHIFLVLVTFVSLFFFLRWVGFKLVAAWMPKTSKELAQEKMKDELERLETVKMNLELKRVEATIAEDELKLEKEIQKSQMAIDKLKEKLEGVGR